MGQDTILHRRQVLAALGALGATAGAGTASAQEGSDQAENSVRMRFPDCSSVKITGANTLVKDGVLLVIGGYVIDPEGGWEWVTYRTHISKLPFDEDVEQELLDNSDTENPVGALVSVARLGRGDGVLAHEKNPDKDECLSELR